MGGKDFPNEAIEQWTAILVKDLPSNLRVAADKPLYDFLVGHDSISWRIP